MKNIYNEQNENDFDNIFKRKLYNYEANPSENAMDKIFAAMPEVQKPAKKFPFFWIIASIVTLLCLLSLWFSQIYSEKNVLSMNHVKIDLPIKMMENQEKNTAEAKILTENQEIKNENKLETSAIKEKNLTFLKEKKTILRKKNSPKNVEQMPIQEEMVTKNQLISNEKNKVAQENVLIEENSKNKHIDTTSVIAILPIDFTPKVLQPIFEDKIVLAKVLSNTNEVSNHNKTKEKNAISPMYIQLGLDAGILAGFRHVEITMPGEMKAQNYKYKSGFASSKGLYALLPITSHWSVKGSIHQICLQENVEMLYANTSPDAYKSLKTDSLSLSCEPIFNKNSYKQTIQMQMMQLGLGVFYQNMSKKPLRYRVGAQANYLSVMNFDLKNKPMTNLVVDESTKKMDTYNFSKQNWSGEVQASLIYDISKKFRILSTVNYQFLTKDLFRGTSNVKAQNVGIHLGIEIALAKVK